MVICAPSLGFLESQHTVLSGFATCLRQAGPILGTIPKYLHFQHKDKYLFLNLKWIINLPEQRQLLFILCKVYPIGRGLNILNNLKIQSI